MGHQRDDLTAYFLFRTAQERRTRGPRRPPGPGRLGLVLVLAAAVLGLLLVFR